MKFDDYFSEQLKNPKVKKEWDDIQPEMDASRAMIDDFICYAEEQNKYILKRARRELQSYV